MTMASELSEFLQVRALRRGDLMVGLSFCDDTRDWRVCLSSDHRALVISPDDARRLVATADDVSREPRWAGSPDLEWLRARLSGIGRLADSADQLNRRKIVPGQAMPGSTA